MSTHASTGLYKEDLYCSNPNNLITNELQTLQTPGIDDYYFIIPHAAPFFVETLEIRNHQSGQLYVEGVDYLIGHYFVDAMRSLKRPLAGSIRFLRRNITGTVRLKYHTVGGQWGFNSNAILEELASKQLNPIVRSWELIDVLPAKFPTIDHDQSVDQLVGSDQIVSAIERISDVLEATAAGTSEAHISNRNNPHQVTKAQVGLGSVANYAPATLAQVLDVNLATAYVTPQTLHHALNNGVIASLNQHVNDTNNPHKTTKAQVGLGSVPNLPLANSTQAIDPLNNATFMSPYTTALMIQRLASTERVDDLELALQAFIDRRDNPHQVTAAQVGTLTTAEIEALITGAGTGEAITLGGYTLEQILDMVVEDTEMTTILEGLSTTFIEQMTRIYEVDPDLEDDIAEDNAAYQAQFLRNFTVGNGGYTVSSSEGTGIIRTTEVITRDVAVSGVEKMAFAGNMIYGIAANGGVVGMTEDSLAVENTYNGDHPLFSTSNSISVIKSTRTARYMQKVSGALMRSTGPAHVEQLALSFNDFWCNTEYKYPGELVIVDVAGGLDVYGHPEFNDAFQPFYRAVRDAYDWEDFVDLAIVDTHIVMLFGDVAIAGEINREGTMSFGPIREVVQGATAISGNGNHIGILDGNGKLHFVGELEGCEDEIDSVVTDFACGGGFTIIADDKGFIEVWGGAPDNSLLFDVPMRHDYV